MEDTSQQLDGGIAA